MNALTPYLAALAPSTGLGVLFWLLMRSILRADRSERAAARRAQEKHSETPRKDRP